MCDAPAGHSPLRGADSSLHLWTALTIDRSPHLSRSNLGKRPWWCSQAANTHERAVLLLGAGPPYAERVTGDQDFDDWYREAWRSLASVDVRSPEWRVAMDRMHEVSDLEAKWRDLADE